jgi:hypothetical protein
LRGVDAESAEDAFTLAGPDRCSSGVGPGSFGTLQDTVRDVKPRARADREAHRLRRCQAA